jgi:hypothetical protein
MLSPARQQAVMDAIDRRFAPLWAKEIARASYAAAASVEQTGAVGAMVDHAAAVRDLMHRQSEVSIRMFAGPMLADMPKGSAPDLERKDFSAIIAKFALAYIMQEAIRRKIVAISDTTRGRIIEQVSEGFTQGLGNAATAKLIRDAVPIIARARSQTIARTETHGAANYGAIESAKTSRLTLQKYWIAAEDERTRIEHANMHGTQVAMDAAFDFGDYRLMFPGDPAGPPEGIINCRCVLAYVPV